MKKLLQDNVDRYRVEGLIFNKISEGIYVGIYKNQEIKITKQEYPGKEYYYQINGGKVYDLYPSVKIAIQASKEFIDENL